MNGIWAVRRTKEMASTTAKLVNLVVEGSARERNFKYVQPRLGHVGTGSTRALRAVLRKRANRANPRDRPLKAPVSAGLFARRNVPRPIQQNEGLEGPYNFKDLQRYYAKRPYLVLARVAELIGYACRKARKTGDITCSASRTRERNNRLLEISFLSANTVARNTRLCDALSDDTFDPTTHFPALRVHGCWRSSSAETLKSGRHAGVR